MSTSSQTQVTPQRIMQFAWGYVPPLVIEAAMRNRVFDVLDGGAKTVEEVHRETGASIRGLLAIMNALVGIELLAKDAEDRFSLTPESATFLVSSKPSFFGGMIRHTSEDLIPKWLSLSEIVATGKPSRSVNDNIGAVEFFQKFVADLFPMSYPPAQALAKHLNLNGAGKPVHVLDLAAGSGVWGIALAQSSPNVRVSAVDLAGVISITRSMAERFGLSNRFSFIEGDLLETNFGSNYAIATLGHILHSEGEARSRALLVKTFAALEPGGTIAIAEFLVNQDRRGPAMGLFFAVNMLVNTENGNAYSFEEISGWLRDAGFTNPRTLEAPGPSPLILATKPA